MIVVLIGYMASGKSTIGKILAEKLEYSFVDLDQYIVDKESQSISQIFNTRGQIYFRKRESEYLRQVLDSGKHMVLALGGGTPCYGGNMNALKSQAGVTSIYLQSSIASVIKRVWAEKDGRPLIAHLESKQDLQEFIGKHLFDRAPFYNQADIIEITDDRNPNEIATAILDKLS